MCLEWILKVFKNSVEKHLTNVLFYKQKKNTFIEFKKTFLDFSETISNNLYVNFSNGLPCKGG